MAKDCIKFVPKWRNFAQPGHTESALEREKKAEKFREKIGRR